MRIQYSIEAVPSSRYGPKKGEEETATLPFDDVTDPEDDEEIGDVSNREQARYLIAKAKYRFLSLEHEALLDEISHLRRKLSAEEDITSSVIDKILSKEFGCVICSQLLVIGVVLNAPSEMRPKI